MASSSQRLLVAIVALLSMSSSLHHHAVAQAQQQSKDVPESHLRRLPTTMHQQYGTQRNLAWQELDCPADRPVPSPEDFIAVGDAPVDLGDRTSISVVGTTIARAPWRCMCNATIEYPTGVADGDQLFLFVGGSDGLNGAWTDGQDVPSSRLGRLISEGWTPILKAGSTDLNIVALTKIYEAGQQGKGGNAVARRNAMEIGADDGETNAGANNCIACSNTPSPKMVKREQNCSTYKFAFTDRCGTEGSWWGQKNKPKYCQYSCWNNNASYADDLTQCCERGDEDDSLLDVTKPSNNTDSIGEKSKEQEEKGRNKKDLPLSTAPIVSNGIRVSLHSTPMDSSVVCIECSNIPTPKMIERGENCSTYEFGFTDRCGNDGSWWGRNNRPKHCQYSCWLNGTGYADDLPCCERTDEDDFVVGSIENNAQDDQDGESLTVEPPSPTTVISDGVRNTWLTMVAIRGLDPERAVRGTEYLKTKSAKTCKTGEAMTPGLRMARGGAFLAVVNFDDPHTGTIISPEKTFHVLASFSSGDDGMLVAISGEPTSGSMMEDVHVVGQSKISGGGQAIGLSLSLRGE